MLSIILDFEASGVQPTEARPLELGMGVYNSETWAPILLHSEVIFDRDYPVITKEVLDLTGISMDELLQSGVTFAQALTKFGHVLAPYIEKIDFIIAYNKQYDHGVFMAESVRKEIRISPLDGLHWMCAMTGVEENYALKCWKLSHLALDHGVAVNPKGLHRALADVQLTAAMLKEIGTTAHKIHAFEKVPWVVVQALVPTPWTDGGKGIALAKGCGYSWEQVKGTDQTVPKCWVKRIKATKLEDEKASAPFKIKELSL